MATRGGKIAAMNARRVQLTNTVNVAPDFKHLYSVRGKVYRPLESREVIYINGVTVRLNGNVFYGTRGLFDTVQEYATTGGDDSYYRFVISGGPWWRLEHMRDIRVIQDPDDGPTTQPAKSPDQYKLFSDNAADPLTLPDMKIP